MACVSTSKLSGWSATALKNININMFSKFPTSDRICTHIKWQMPRVLIKWTHWPKNCWLHLFISDGRMCKCCCCRLVTCFTIDFYRVRRWNRTYSAWWLNWATKLCSWQPQVENSFCIKNLVYLSISTIHRIKWGEPRFHARLNQIWGEKHVHGIDSPTCAF